MVSYMKYAPLLQPGCYASRGHNNQAGYVTRVADYAISSIPKPSVQSISG